MIRHEVDEPMGFGLVLAADGDATGAARHRLRAFLHDRGAPDDRTTDAELLLTELVSNAAAQTASDVEVYVRVDRGSLRMWVSDEAPGAGARVRRWRGRRGGAPVRPPDDWGLELVHTLASGWGVRPRVDARPGKTVWAEVSLVRPRPVARPPDRAAR